MLATHVLKHFWGEAVLTAAYLINRMPSRLLNFQAPCQELLEIYPNAFLVSSIPTRIFGCTVFFHIHQQQRSKLDPKFVRCIFLGYSPFQKRYKCYSPLTRKFYNYMDVTFFENQPFYAKANIQGESEREFQLWETGHETEKITTSYVALAQISIPIISPISEPESNTQTQPSSEVPEPVP